VPKLAMPTLQDSNLVAIKLCKPQIYRTLGLITRRGHSMGYASSQLYAMIEQVAQSANLLQTEMPED